MREKIVLAALLLSVTFVMGQQKTMMGWSSWNTFRVNINEDLIKASADAMVSTGLKEAGYNYVNVDDGWFGGGRNADGTVKHHQQRFPSGMKAIAEYCHSLGLKAGIFLMPE